MVGVRGHRCGDAERRRRRLRPRGLGAAGLDRASRRVDRGRGRGGAGIDGSASRGAATWPIRVRAALVHRVEPARRAGGRGEDADRPGAVDEGHGERGLRAGAAGRGIGGARDERDVVHAHGASGGQGFSADGAVDLDDVADLARRTRGRRDADEPTLDQDGDGGRSLDDGGDGVRERLRRAIREVSAARTYSRAWETAARKAACEPGAPSSTPGIPTRHRPVNTTRRSVTDPPGRVRESPDAGTTVAGSPSCSSRLGRAHWIRRDDR